MAARPASALLQHLLKPFLGMRKRSRRRVSGDGDGGEAGDGDGDGDGGHFLLSFFSPPPSSSSSASVQDQNQHPEAKHRLRHRPGAAAALGSVAVLYIAVDYLRISAPSLHSGLQPLLWAALAVAAASRAPFYPHWSCEIRAAPAFLAALAFMLLAFCTEAIAVQFVTSVLGLAWHQEAAPLPDTGQWLLLALNERLPSTIVEMLRAHLFVLQHYMMLFLMLAFSVLFDFVKAPGLGLAARYMFSMGVGRLLRVMTFVATILPSARPWCAQARFSIPSHPHPWAQKFYIPYATDARKIQDLLTQDMAYASVGEYPAEYVPNWGSMQFLVNLLRPLESSGGESWFTTLKRAGGGCNDLIFSGHVLVSSLTAMAWTEAYPGWTSVFLWLSVLHTAQREIRERHHYSVDVVSGIYMGVLIWKSTGFIWAPTDRAREARLQMLGKLESRIVQAAKDGDVSAVRELLKQVEDAAGREKQPSRLVINVAASIVITFSLGIAVLAFFLTTNG